MFHNYESRISLFVYTSLGQLRLQQFLNNIFASCHLMFSPFMILFVANGALQPLLDSPSLTDFCPL